MTPAENIALDIPAIQQARRETGLGYPFRLLDEMVGNQPAKRWLIKGIFARGETSAWIAPPGGMKSALMASACIAVASGINWLGMRNKADACEVGVVYFALERADLVERRLRAHRMRLGLETLPIAVVSASVDLMKPDSYRDVMHTVRAFETSQNVKAGFIVFDTFAKLIAAGGGDENLAKDQGLVFASLQRIKANVDAHIAIVGHTGKDETRGARGSNAFLGDVDVMVTISGDVVRTASVIKANDMPEGPLFSFRSETHEFGIDEDGDPITVNVIGDDPAQESPKCKRGQRWPKGLRLVHDAITAAIIDSPIEHSIAGQGPAVRAVEVQAARAIHEQRYVSNGDGNRSEAERKSWSRNFKVGRDDGLILGETFAGKELIWLATQ